MPYSSLSYYWEVYLRKFIYPLCRHICYDQTMEMALKIVEQLVRKDSDITMIPDRASVYLKEG